MCGNFGLLLLGRSGARNNINSNSDSNSSSNSDSNRSSNSNSNSNDNGDQDNSDQGIAAAFKSDVDATSSTDAPNSASSTAISISDESINADGRNNKRVSSVMSVVEILKRQTAATEIRGGQAGGFRYKYIDTSCFLSL